MPSGPPANLTDLINRRGSVDKPELEALAAELWPRLERLAARQLQGRSGLTLQASDLAQDAYIALMHDFPGRFNDREHFYALAARIVRNIVVDYPVSYTHLVCIRDRRRSSSSRSPPTASTQATSSWCWAIPASPTAR